MSVVALQGENGPVGLFLKAPFPEGKKKKKVNCPKEMLTDLSGKNPGSKSFKDESKKQR